MARLLNNSMSDSLGIYVQVPFCASKCSFCNFSSQVAHSNAYEPYAAALIREISLVAPREARQGSEFGALPVNTLYWGGGTPTLLGSAHLRRIFDALQKAFRLDQVVEHTIELTPASADRALLDDLLRLGVNRLSIGAQSFDDRELRTTGRLHSAEETSEQVEAARRASYRNLNLDLIAGLPFQTIESWRKSLQALAWLNPEHVSIYLFEADEKSRLGREVLSHGSGNHATAMPGEEFMCRAYEIACEFLQKEGYVHYEISNFARPGYESIHNRKYWRRQPYLGFGAGAHSFDGERRWANETAPDMYEHRVADGALPTAEEHSLEPCEHAEEFFFLGLREMAGVSLDFAERRWGSAPYSRWKDEVERLESEGFLTRSDGRVRLAEHALLVSNEIFQQFLR
ncbi:MAG: radical SAM family heme chaperone HemW [Terriglobia bacterium]